LKSITASLGLFFSVYLPLTALIGLIAGSFQAPGLERSVSYELFLWFVVATQLVAPSLAAFVGVLFLLKVLVRVFDGRSAGTTRVFSLTATALTLPTIQALAWDGNQISVDWFLVSVIPAALLGFAIVSAQRTSGR